MEEEEIEKHNIEDGKIKKQKIEQENENRKT